MKGVGFMKKYRSFLNEFKRELISIIENGSLSHAEDMLFFLDAPSLIDRWRKQIQSNMIKDIPSVKEKQLEKELDKYKKKAGELTLQVDLFKKSEYWLGVYEKIKWVNNHRQEIGSIKGTCRMINLNSSTYYYINFIQLSATWVK
jgi:hypothetical protein